MFIYGALVEHRTEDERADIDAILNGHTAPSAARAHVVNHDGLLELAFMGDVVGEVRGADR